MNIYYTFYDETTAFEAKAKGYRLDVWIETNGGFYPCAVYNPVRLLQDFKTEHQQYGYYDVDVNLILVNEVTTEQIISTVIHLEKTGYFTHLLPQQNVDANTLTLVYSETQGSSLYYL